MFYRVTPHVKGNIKTNFLKIENYNSSNNNLYFTSIQKVYILSKAPVVNLFKTKITPFLCTGPGLLGYTWITIQYRGPTECINCTLSLSETCWVILDCIYWHHWVLLGKHTKTQSSVSPLVGICFLRDH